MIALASGFAAGCRSSRPQARAPEPGSRKLIEKGEASWYGPGFHGRRTANGERFDGRGMTAAHQTLPFDTLVEVVNLDNGRSAVVRINDRGPFARKRIIDLSRTAAEALGVIGPGIARVELYTVAGAAVPAPRPFTVQVGAFHEPERAQSLADELVPRFSGVEVHSDGTWYRVQVARFDRRDTADDLRCRLAEAGYPAVVVEVNGEQ